MSGVHGTKVLIFHRKDSDRVPISEKFDAALVLIIEEDNSVLVWKNMIGGFKGHVPLGKVFGLDIDWSESRTS